MARQAAKTERDPDVAGGEVNLGDLSKNISYATRLLRALVRQKMQVAFYGLDILPGAASVLAVIAYNPEISQNDIAGTVALKKSQVTRIVSDLVERRLVDRKESAVDRRFNALTLTAEGRRLWAKLEKRMEAHNEAVLAPLTARERKEILRLTYKLIDALSDENQPLEADE